MAFYRDHPTVSTSVEVSASPGELWPLISDINLPAQFSEEFQGAQWTPPATGPAVGAMFVGSNKHPQVGEWQVPCHVSVCDPDRAFGWDPGGPDGVFTRWRLTLDPNGSTTTLTFTAQMGLGPSGLTPAIERSPEFEEQIVDGRLEEWRANMLATIEGIKAIVERR